MPLDVVDILQSCVFFEKMPERSFKRLATMAQLRHFRKGQKIFREGDECPGVYVVGAGTIRVFKIGAGGKEHVLHIVGPGQTFAEAAAIGDFDLPASAEAVTRSACVLLPLAPFQKAMAEDIDLSRGMLLGVTMWVRHMVRLLEDLVLRDATGRIARFLLEAERDGDVVKLPGLKRHVASHLNLTGETFSRTFRRLVESGVIAEGKKSQVHILDEKALRRTAQGLHPLC